MLRYRDNSPPENIATPTTAIPMPKEPASPIKPIQEGMTPPPNSEATRSVSDTAKPWVFGALIADKAFDLHKSPLVSLLEAKLSQREEIQLLERAQIDRILQEQQLQLISSARGVHERIAAGKLLKADLLVLLRAREKGDIRQLDIIVAETKGGLRLLVRTILWSDDTLRDVNVLNSLMSQALEKYDGEIRQIVAVPPFVSNDLTHEYDFLQVAYSLKKIYRVSLMLF